MATNWKNAEYSGNCQKAVVKTFAQLPHLHDYIELIVL
jgi:hypothetical protein